MNLGFRRRITIAVTSLAFVVATAAAGVGLYLRNTLSRQVEALDRSELERMQSEVTEAIRDIEALALSVSVQPEVLLFYDFVRSTPAGEVQVRLMQLRDTLQVLQLSSERVGLLEVYLPSIERIVGVPGTTSRNVYLERYDLQTHRALNIAMENRGIAGSTWLRGRYRNNPNPIILHVQPTTSGVVLVTVEERTLVDRLSGLRRDEATAIYVFHDRRLYAFLPGSSARTVADSDVVLSLRSGDRVQIAGRDYVAGRLPTAGSSTCLVVLRDVQHILQPSIQLLGFSLAAFAFGTVLVIAAYRYLRHGFLEPLTRISRSALLSGRRPADEVAAFRAFLRAALSNSERQAARRSRESEPNQGGTILSGLRFPKVWHHNSSRRYCAVSCVVETESGEVDEDGQTRLVQLLGEALELRPASRFGRVSTLDGALRSVIEVKRGVASVASAGAGFCHFFAIGLAYGDVELFSRDDIFHASRRCMSDAPDGWSIVDISDMAPRPKPEVLSQSTVHRLAMDVTGADPTRAARLVESIIETDKRKPPSVRLETATQLADLTSVLCRAFVEPGEAQPARVEDKLRVARSSFNPDLAAKSLIDAVLALRAPKFDGDRLKTIDLYINAVYADSQITLARAAEELGFSYAHLSHYIRENFGVGFTELIRRKRIAAAIRLLESTGDTIATVGEQVGYDSTQTFIRAFRAETGGTPGAYRKEARFSEISTSIANSDN